MDVLKILSRGTKAVSKGRKGLAAVPETNLPSAGAKPNPQLFHDDAHSSRSRKRKRTDEEKQHEFASDDPLPEFDFFSSKTGAEPGGVSTATETTAEDDRGKTHDTTTTTATATITTTNSNSTQKPLDEDGCRQLFKSHRIKITPLFALQERPRDAPTASEKKRKNNNNNNKKRKPSEEATVVHKNAKKHQLFPQPLTSFSQLRSVYRISPRVAENLAKQSYRLPTEVQMASLPLLLRPEEALLHEGCRETREQAARRGGLDFLAVAPTGSGKTISFLIPAINGIMRRRAEEGTRGTHALGVIVVVPTRELAFQIVNEGKKLAAGTGVSIMVTRKGMRMAVEEGGDVVEEEEVVEGGGGGEVVEEEEVVGEENKADEPDNSEDDEEDPGDETKKSRRTAPPAKVDILVTTPLLLLNLLASGTKAPRRTLPSVRTLVLDEADVLLDPLFREQTLGIWASCTNPALRLSLWSATMGASIEALVSLKLSSQPDPAPFLRLVVGLKDTAVPNVTHKLTYTASEQGKLLALRQLLGPGGSAHDSAPLRPPFLVFTQTVERAASLHHELKYDIPPEAGGPARIAALHGGLSESLRSAIMRRFRAGEIWVLITTDVLARGIDFAGVNGIVNYDIPNTPAAYVHRAGRTGRAGREGGVAVTFYTREDIPFVKTVANVVALSEKQAGRSGSGVQKWLLDALPKVAKADRKRLKERGVEVRRSGAKGARITTKSGWERRRENNRRGAIEASKKRRSGWQVAEGGGGDEWDGFED